MAMDSKRMSSTKGRARTTVFDDQNLVPLILNHLAVPDVDRSVRPVPESLPNDLDVAVKVVVDFDLRRLKVRAALDALPGVLRGMAALATVCRGWRDHISKGHVVAVQRLLGLRAKPSMLQLRADLIQVTRLRGAIADLAPVAFTQSVITYLAHPEIGHQLPFPNSDVVVRQCNLIYDRIRQLTAEHPGAVNVRGFELDIDDPDRIDRAKASRLTQLLFRREGFGLSLPARDDVLMEEWHGDPINLLTDGGYFSFHYIWRHKVSDMHCLVNERTGVILPRLSGPYYRSSEDVGIHQLMPAVRARDPDNTDISQCDLEIDFSITLSHQEVLWDGGITIEIQGWCRDNSDIDGVLRPFFSEREPYFCVRLCLPCLEDVRVCFRDGRAPMEASMENAEIAMAAPLNIT